MGSQLNNCHTAEMLEVALSPSLLRFVAATGLLRPRLPCYQCIAVCLESDAILVRQEAVACCDSYGLEKLT